MNKDAVIAKVYEVWGAACKTFKLKNTSVPAISFFSKSSIAGKAWYSEHRVEFNEILALENSYSFETTIAHELAHLITDQLYPQAKQHHGPEFKHVMETMGYDPRTYHSYDVSSVATRRVKTRFIYLCNSCHKTLEIAGPTHKKILAGSIYTCKCGGRITFTNEERKFV